MTKGLAYLSMTAYWIGLELGVHGEVLGREDCLLRRGNEEIYTSKEDAKGSLYRTMFKPWL